MAEVESSLIKKGFWINHSKGRVLGATITTDQEVSNAIIALLAVLVAIAAASAWNLLLFALHQSRATSKPKDGLHHQQQALFRSLAAPGSIMTDSFKMLKIWNGKVPRAILRCVIPAVLGLLFACATLLAGVFSSNVISTSNLEVLVAGNLCRDFNMLAFFEAVWSGNQAAAQFSTSSTQATTLYTDQCYAEGALPSRCNGLVHPRITVAPSSTACPFEETICLLNGTSAAVVFDTDYIDSHDIFGINNPKHRVQLRRKATCAPLQIAQHVSTIDPDEYLEPFLRATSRQPIEGEQLRLISYGGPSPIPEYPNATWSSSTVTGNGTSLMSLRAIFNASSPVLSVFYYWTPYEELRRSNADLALLLFEMNRVRSYTPIDDPIYSAHRTALDLNNDTVYSADLPAGVVACAEQYQYCITRDAGSRHCTPFSGSIINGFEELLPSATSEQLAMLSMLGAAAARGGLAAAANQKPAYLEANNQIGQGYMAGLPTDQWIRDLVKLESWARADIQNHVLFHATGYGVKDDQFLIEPQTAAGEVLCRSQKVIKPGGFANISVFGLAFVVALAGLLVTLDFGMLRVLIYTANIKQHLAPGIQFWIQDGIFQVQRCAYELYGAGTWHRIDKEIPAAAKGDLFTDLNSYKAVSLQSQSNGSPAPASLHRSSTSSSQGTNNNTAPAAPSVTTAPVSNTVSPTLVPAQPISAPQSVQLTPNQAVSTASSPPAAVQSQAQAPPSQFQAQPLTSQPAQRASGAQPLVAPSSQVSAPVQASTANAP